MEIQQLKDVLGMKRLIILGVLMAISATQAAALYFHYIESNKQLSSEINRTQSRTTKLNKETDVLVNDFERIKTQQQFLDKILAAGFISRQNRLEATELIGDIQRFTDILSAGYSISSAEENMTDLTKEINHVVVTSRVTLEVRAFNDIAIYQFAYWVENTFPGHIAMTSLQLSRERDVNNKSVTDLIADRGRIPLVSGTINFLWHTVAEDKSSATKGLEDAMQALGLGEDEL